MWKNKFSSHKQYVIGLLFSKNAKKSPKDPSILQTSLLYLKRNVSQTFKNINCKKVSLQCVYHFIDTTWFDECFLFYVITGRYYFLYKFIVTQRFGTTAMLLSSLKQVFWKKSALYISYLHNNITMLLLP